MIESEHHGEKTLIVKSDEEHIDDYRLEAFYRKDDEGASELAYVVLYRDSLYTKDNIYVDGEQVRELANALRRCLRRF